MRIEIECAYNVVNKDAFRHGVERYLCMWYRVATRSVVVTHGGSSKERVTF